MAPRHVAPSISLKSFSCPRCGALADQKWFEVRCTPVADDKPPVIATLEWVREIKARKLPKDEQIPRTVIESWERAAGGDIRLEETQNPTSCWLSLDNVHVSRCHSCKDVSLWRHDTVLFPFDRYSIEPNEDMDAEIRADFDEARAIVDISPRAAAALLRLCIQKLCKQLGKPGENLNDDIASLVKDGLHPDVQRALDVVRVIGNESVHPGKMNLKDDRDTAAKLFELVNYIADDRITRPKKVAGLYAILPSSKIEAIEKRDGVKP